jgi:hypothetical protein
VHSRRAEVWAQIARAQALCQAGHTSAPQFGARAALCQIPIQEHRYAEVFAKLISHDKRLRTRGAPLARIEIDKRHDIERAHVRVHSDLIGIAILDDVDALNGYARASEQGAGQRTLGSCKREH